MFNPAGIQFKNFMYVLNFKSTTFSTSSPDLVGHSLIPWDTTWWSILYINWLKLEESKSNKERKYRQEQNKEKKNLSDGYFQQQQQNKGEKKKKRILTPIFNINRTKKKKKIIMVQEFLSPLKRPMNREGDDDGGHGSSWSSCPPLPPSHPSSPVPGTAPT